MPLLMVVVSMPPQFRVFFQIEIPLIPGAPVPSVIVMVPPMFMAPVVSFFVIWALLVTLIYLVITNAVVGKHLTRCAKPGDAAAQENRRFLHLKPPVQLLTG